MKDDEAIEEAISAFRDFRIDSDQLYDRLVAAGCSPEDAAETIDVECGADE